MQVGGSCFLLVWFLLTWKGHTEFHSQLCSGSFTPLCKERMSQQLRYCCLVPRILDMDQGPHILPLLYSTEWHGQSYPVSAPSFLMLFVLPAAGATPPSGGQAPGNCRKHCRRTRSLLGYLGQGDCGNCAQFPTAYVSPWKIKLCISFCHVWLWPVEDDFKKKPRLEKAS